MIPRGSNCLRNQKIQICKQIIILLATHIQLRYPQQISKSKQKKAATNLLKDISKFDTNKANITSLSGTGKQILTFNSTQQDDTMNILKNKVKSMSLTHFSQHESASGSYSKNTSQFDISKQFQYTNNPVYLKIENQKQFFQKRKLEQTKGLFKQAENLEINRVVHFKKGGFIGKGYYIIEISSSNKALNQIRILLSKILM
ncbi:UNKNOWN [Stylonychia lemnae]|uniref:Uncharacterized protein n=1 Tax=Stylonychia lemnae TaxID=5949 RepID=A0A078AZE0_STYLE|nr:UNKNOWN [Stylonychia lemnae]|eukprot:CDW87476.1 UNKNOWN [Stylonychia lemnae]